MLSSSPAAQPSSGQHLHGEKPTVFGSVAAQDSQSKKTTIGFAGGKDGNNAPAANGAPAKSMDFQKLFQGSGSPAPSQATASNAFGSPSQSSAAPASTAPSTPQANNAAQSQGGARHASSNLRPPSGTPHHPVPGLLSLNVRLRVTRVKDPGSVRSHLTSNSTATLRAVLSSSLSSHG